MIAYFLMWHTGKPAAEQCEGEPASGAGHKVPRRLVGFAPVEVAPGESAEVAVVVSRRALSTFEPGRGWREPSGPTILSVGRSSRDLRLQAWLE